MRVWKPKYRDKKTGKLKPVSKYWIEVRDHLEIIRRFPDCTDKGKTEELGRQIGRLVASRKSGDQPDVNLTRWLEGVPNKLREKFVKAGLLDRSRAAAGKTLATHIEDFRKSLRVGNTERHVRVTCSRIQRVFDECGFKYWSELSANEIKQAIWKLRKSVEVVEKETIKGKTVKRKKQKDLGEISVKTMNYYLTAVRQFAKWMVMEGRAVSSPVEYLERFTEPDDNEHRRAFSFEEVCRLLEATEKAPRRFGMDGHARAVLYLLTIETGLRVSELRSLKISSFDFTNCEVMVEAKYCKNRKKSVQLLKYSRTKQLKDFFANKLQGVLAFDMPTHHYTADVLKADLVKAKIAYIDELGRKGDFHALRHTLATALDETGASLAERMAIMRHSNKSNLTLGTYTHPQAYNIRRAIESLPPYPWPGQTQSETLAATGTDDLALYLAPEDGKIRTSTDFNGQSKENTVNCA